MTAQSVESLVPTDRVRLAELEATVERGLATFVEVGQALSEIRNARLYRETHGTFEAYVLERWGRARQTAYHYITAAEVAANVSPVSQPASLRHALELAPLPPDEQRELAPVVAELPVREAREVVRAHRMGVHYSSETPEWSTPQPLFEALDREFHFTLDVCATPENKAGLLPGVTLEAPRFAGSARLLSLSDTQLRTVAGDETVAGPVTPRAAEELLGHRHPALKRVPQRLHAGCVDEPVADVVVWPRRQVAVAQMIEGAEQRHRPVAIQLHDLRAEGWRRDLVQFCAELAGGVRSDRMKFSDQTGQLLLREVSLVAGRELKGHPVESRKAARA